MKTLRMAYFKTFAAFVDLVKNYMNGIILSLNEKVFYKICCNFVCHSNVWSFYFYGRSRICRHRKRICSRNDKYPSTALPSPIKYRNTG